MTYSPETRSRLDQAISHLARVGIKKTGDQEIRVSDLRDALAALDGAVELLTYFRDYCVPIVIEDDHPRPGDTLLRGFLDHAQYVEAFLANLTEKADG